MTENLPEGQDAQGSVGFVAGVVRHSLAPEVVGKNVPPAGTWSYVWVVDDSPDIVVDQLPMERVAETQGTQSEQHRIATVEPSRPRLDLHPRPLLLGFLLPSRHTRRCHVGPGAMASQE